MAWRKGTGLGTDGTGRVDRVKLVVKHQARDYHAGVDRGRGR